VPSFSPLLLLVKILKSRVAAKFTTCNHNKADCREILPAALPRATPTACENSLKTAYCQMYCIKWQSSWLLRNSIFCTTSTAVEALLLLSNHFYCCTSGAEDKISQKSAVLSSDAVGCHNLQVSFRKRANNYRALLQKETQQSAVLSSDAVHWASQLCATKFAIWDD